MKLRSDITDIVVTGDMDKNQYGVRIKFRVLNVFREIRCNRIFTKVKIRWQN